MELIVAFGIVAIVLIVSALAAGLVERAPLSFPIIFLGVGALLGERVFNLIQVGPEDPAVHVVTTITLCLVLFLDAVNLEPPRHRGDWLVPALALGPGTLLIIALTAGAGILIAGLDLIPALLLGTVLSSTDPVVLRDVVRDRRIPTSVRRALSVEAGTNDIVVLPILLVLSAISLSDLHGPAGWISFGTQLFIIGPLAGFAVGAIGSWLMTRVDKRFGIRKEYQALYGVGLVLASYVAGESVGGDGFLGAFAAGLAVTLLNQELCSCFLEFGEAAAEMAMLLSFVLFGALLTTTDSPIPWLWVLGLAALVIFLVRPLSIWLVLSLRRATLSRTARIFIAWFGPRGLNSLLFALILIKEGVPGSTQVFALAGFVVVVSVVLHGASATPLSAWYGNRASSETLAEGRESTASGLFHEAAPDRISAEELRARQRSDPQPLLVDVRSRFEFDRDPEGIPGSVRVKPDEVREWAGGLPEGTEIVLFCT